MIKIAFGTYDIAKICQVTPPTVGRWIEEGKIPSFTTAGGHRRVWRKDLAEFLKSLNMPVPLELVADESLRILIVDDEPEVRRFVSRVIRKHYPGAVIHEAADGFEAGQKIVTVSPALVVLDIQLPGINGIKVCQLVRADEKLRDIKILAITGYAVEETRKQMRASGADDFLAKPFSPEDLAAVLEKLLPARPSEPSAPRVRG